MAMSDAVLMPVIMVVAVVVAGVGMIVATAAARAMDVRLRLRVRIGVRVRMIMGMIMLVMSMIMPVMAMVVIGVVAAGMVVGAALGLEGAGHHGHGAALAAHHFGQDMVVFDIDRVGGDFRRGVTIADMPGDPHQAQRVLGADFQQALRRRPDLHQASVFEPHGIAIVQAGRLVQVEEDIEAAIALQRDATPASVLMVKGQGLDDLVGFDRRLANDRGGAQHDEIP